MPLVYLDTCILIGGFETASPMAGLIGTLFAELQKKPLVGLTSEMTLAELLAPTKQKNGMTIDERRDIYIPLIDEGAFIEMRPVTRPVLLRTVSLRASFPRRVPDAIHIATALEADCRSFLSQDRDARRRPPGLTWVEANPAGIALVLDALRA